MDGTEEVIDPDAFAHEDCNGDVDGIGLPPTAGDQCVVDVIVGRACFVATRVGFGVGAGVDGNERVTAQTSGIERGDLRGRLARVFVGERGAKDRVTGGERA